MSGIFGSTTVEVAIGLFFVYWLLSIVCSTIQETIAAVFKWRAQDLEKGLLNMLCDGDIAFQVLNHPLITAMGNTRAETAVIRGASGGSSGQPSGGSGQQNVSSGGWVLGKQYAGKPSYIPARTFTTALFDTLAPSTGGPLTIERLRREAEQRVTSKGEGAVISQSLLAIIEQSRDPAVLFENVDRVKKSVEAYRTDPADPATTTAKQELLSKLSLAQTIDDLQHALDDMQDGPLKTHFSNAVQALKAQVDTAQVKLETVRQNVENWFDHSMDRVSGIYKRRAHTWLLCLAFILTFSLGADTLAMARMLAANSTLRSAIVSQAGAAVATPATTGTQAAGAGASLPPSTESKQVVSDLHEVESLFGYQGVIPPPGDTDVNGQPIPPADWWEGYAKAAFLKLIGMSLTAFAVSLGAPFWFDLLQKLVNVRSSGPKPEDREKQQSASQPSS